MIAEILTEAN